MWKSTGIWILRSLFRLFQTIFNNLNISQSSRNHFSPGKSEVSQYYFCWEVQKFTPRASHKFGQNLGPPLFENSAVCCWGYYPSLFFLLFVKWGRHKPECNYNVSERKCTVFFLFPTEYILVLIKNCALNVTIWKKS